ncbi:EVE domain-containing protein [Meiothermus granaticius]|uniref:EVE domain protein n=1 Tax=Meiothermus granaticius NBRC 107808 TaxID=1227551 RepID=A0A399F772_9DEIN|nr:EVE domain-containing protein [Meiothermus granaticius]RIH92078.1 EVE domain protein [Meiothermus granaticius NBRC 107808]GEM85417.1 EVE domain-containing protein [Meiothermus granaticius NBRC 107808]
MAYWLLKSEPQTFSIHDLERDQTTLWDGVRNYQARNYLRSMHPGDRAFFYHSSTAVPGIVGLCRIHRAHLVDPSQFDPHSPYFDPHSSLEQPRWWTVEVQFERAFAQPLPLETLRQQFTSEELALLRRGNRLSVMPVEEAVAKRILKLATP